MAGWHHWVIVPLLFISTATAAELISGVVMDPKHQPIEKVRVRWQARATFVLTDNSGWFHIERPPDLVPNTRLTAGKEGFFNTPILIPKNQTSLHVILKPIPSQDNTAYEWLSPDPIQPEWYRKMLGVSLRVATSIKDERIVPSAAFQCGNCHTSLLKDWQSDAHAQSAINPTVLAFYDSALAPAFRLDFPHSAGNCATCHAPADAIRRPWDTHLRQLSPIGKKGVSCDVCHKMTSTTPDPSGGRPGVLSMQFRRPSGRHQLFLGPLDDVVAGPDSYAPIFQKSQLCASCHSAKFWGVSTYSSFDEWQVTQQARKGIQCQNCHMKPTGKIHNFAPERGGVDRDPQTIHSHKMRGGLDISFFREALDIRFLAQKVEKYIDIQVRIHNKGAAHHIPTDFIGRNMILWIEATDQKGKPYPQIRGSRVPDWGGDLAGFAGKGFAKILASGIKTSFVHSSGQPIISPAPHWNQIHEQSDSRLAADSSDVSSYRFQLPNPASSVEVRGRLIYRRLFYQWAKNKNLPLVDHVIWKISQKISQTPSNVKQL